MHRLRTAAAWRRGMASAARLPLNLSEVGLKVLQAPAVEDKMRWTLEAWDELEQQGTLGPWPPTEHLDAEQAASLRSIPDTDLPGLPTNAVRSLLPASGSWAPTICRASLPGHAAVPDHPARPSKPELVSGKKFRRPKVAANVYLLHALAHVELNACDLYWDTIVRFYDDDVPTQLFVDLLDIARDEAKHFSWLQQRLVALGSGYGALPAHKALWEQGHSSRGSLLARLAVVPLVQEAKALDAADRLRGRMVGAGDGPSAELVAQICAEEVGHVYKGVQWFIHLCLEQGVHPPTAFHAQVARHCPSPLPGPFNETARAMAGMWPEWFRPVSRGGVSRRAWLTMKHHQAGAGTPH